MNVIKRGIALYILFLGITLLYSCRDRTAVSSTRDKALLDSLDLILTEEYAQDPVGAKEFVFRNLPGLTDSLDYYTLQGKLIVYSFYLNQLDSAIYYGQQIMNYLNRQEPLPDDFLDLALKTVNDMGVTYLVLGNFDSSIAYMKQAEKYATRAGDGQKQASVYINLADNYNYKGDFLQTCDYYRKALLIADSLQLPVGTQYAIYNGLARLYTDLGNYSEADYYYRYLEGISEKTSPHDQFFFENSRGYYYFLQKDYRESLSWFRKALSTARTRGMKNNESIAEINLGEVFLMMNRADSARFYLDKALPYLIEENPNPSSLYYIKGLYASLYLSEDKLHEAESLLEELSKMEEYNPTYIHMNNKRLEELYRKQGNFRKAYGYKVKIDAYNDSILDWKIRSNILEIDSRYKQDTTILKQNILIGEKEEAVARLKNLNLILILSAIVITLSAFLISFYRKRKKEQHYIRQKEQIAQLRMENVRNRISPHFIFNVLNALMPSMRQHKELSEPMHRMVQAIRGNLLVSEKIAIPLGQEIELVKNYISLIDSIGSLKATVEWEVREESLSREILVPSMCIQIPVENALKYAFDENDPNNRLTIDISRESDFLHITILDNGCGISPEALSTSSRQGTGHGFKILYKTIQLLNEKNQMKINMQIKNRAEFDSSSGTYISLVIPKDYIYN